MIVETIGLLAAACTTICYFPQAIHVIREKNTDAISLIAYCTLFTGVALWFVYGLCIHDLPLILCNGISLPFICFILAMKIKHKFDKKRP